MVSAWAPYKRIEQAVEACRRLDRPLKIVGAGYADRRRRELARGRVELLGWCDRATLRRLYRRCRALLMPGEEDFGMAAVEAISCGAPVIAYAAGGALESVRDAASGLDNPTGLLYGPQTSEALVGAIVRFERLQEVFDAGAMHRWARQFAPERFAESFKSAVEPLLRERGWQSPW